MGAREMEVATHFLLALQVAARTGDREAVYPLLDDDVEWVTPKRTLRGLDEVREELTWISPPDHLEQEFRERERQDLGDGRIVVDVHHVYRVKATGDFAYERDRRIELTVRDGTVSRYEMRIVG